MNFELKYMKKLQEQKDKILELDIKKQRLAPFGARCLRGFSSCFKSTISDIQSMVFILAAVAAFAFYLTCLSIKKQSEGTETPDTSI